AGTEAAAAAYAIDGVDEGARLGPNQGSRGPAAPLPAGAGAAAFSGRAAVKLGSIAKISCGSASFSVACMAVPVSVQGQPQMGGRQICALYRPVSTLVDVWLGPRLQSGLTKARREGGEVEEFREPALVKAGGGIRSGLHCRVHLPGCVAHPPHRMGNRTARGTSRRALPLFRPDWIRLIRRLLDFRLGLGRKLG